MMPQDLLGLTINIAPLAELESEIRGAKEFFWEGSQISEQFELMALNTCHRFIHEHLIGSVLMPLDKEQISVEIVGKYEQDSLEEWFAIGVGFAGERHSQIIEAISKDCRFPELLCQTLEFEIVQILTRETSVEHVSINAEVTSYASMWG